MQAAGMTHQGHLRARNEDAYWFDERRGFLAIADGLGGHGFGHLASQETIDFVTRDVQSEAFFGMTRHSHSSRPLTATFINCPRITPALTACVPPSPA